MSNTDFILDVKGDNFYMSPKIAPLSLRKYSAGINTDNTIFRIEDGVFFVSTRRVDNEDNKHIIYFVNSDLGEYTMRTIDIETGELDGFIIDGGQWS